MKKIGSQRYFEIIKDIFGMNTKNIIKNYKKSDILLERLEQQKALSKILDYPFENYDVIHVTGTNGKGSVCKKLYDTLINSNYKVGLLTSPHVFVFRERMQVDNELITRNELVDVWEYIKAKIEETDTNVSLISDFLLRLST